MDGEVDERFVIPNEVRKTTLFEVDIFIVLLLIRFRVGWTFSLLDVQEHLLHGCLVHDINKHCDVLMMSQCLDLPGGVTLDGYYNEIPNDSLELQFLDPTILLIIEDKLKKLVENRQRSVCTISGEDDLSEGKQCTDADVLDDRAGEAAIEADGVYPDEDVFIGVLEDLRVYEAEGSLDDPEYHIDILVFVLEQHDDIDHMIEDSIHLLAKTPPLEHFINLPSLRLINDLNEPNDLS